MEEKDKTQQDTPVYRYVNKDTLTEIMQGLFALTDLPIQLLNEKGEILLQFGETTSYCKHFVSHLSSSSVCQEIHASAGKRAMAIGTSYIFSCHSNLSHIVFPLISSSHLLGSILIGPFLLEQPDSSLILDVGKRYSDFSTEDLMELYDDIVLLPQVEPSKVTHISKLLYHMLSSIISDAKEQFIISQKKMHQQSKISESIHNYKKEGVTSDMPYPLEKEHLLLTKLKEGNFAESSAVLNDLLGYVFLYSRNNLATIKYRSIELSSLLSRAALEHGAASDSIFQLNSQFMENMDSYQSTEEVCLAISEVLAGFMECMFPSAKENNRLVRGAMNYISTNFRQDITLQDVADHMHLNAAYFSRVFKQSCGVTFKEYLTQVRMEEAKRLLVGTDLTLSEIALSVGFDNQSYFTSVFKKSTGMTPGQFRK